MLFLAPRRFYRIERRLSLFRHGGGGSATLSKQASGIAINIFNFLNKLKAVLPELKNAGNLFDKMFILFEAIGALV